MAEKAEAFSGQSPLTPRGRIKRGVNAAQKLLVASQQQHLVMVAVDSSGGQGADEAESRVSTL